jgi:hypothetical protein
MTDYDKAARYLIKRDPSGFFRWLLTTDEALFHAWIDARRLALPDQGDLTSDLVGALGVDGGYEAFCAEVQAGSEEGSAARVLFGYLPRLRSESPAPDSIPLSAIGGGVVNLTGRPRRDTVSELPKLAPACRFHGTVLQRSLRDESAEDLLREVTSGRASRWLLAWLPLTDGGTARDNMEEWKREAARLPTERERGTLAILTLTFSDLAKCRDLWQKALERWTVIKSPYLEELREVERKEGRLEGRLEEVLAVLFRMGRKKFGRAPTKKQQAELTGITDLPRLEALTERLLDVDTWAELLAAP